MKITKVSFSAFRAFDESLPLDLDDGKNLLLHGENGSGKSSIYFALRRFFEERGCEIESDRCLFSDDARASAIRIHIVGTDQTGKIVNREFEWNSTDHPLKVPIVTGGNEQSITQPDRSMLVDAARRSGFVDYRALLRTSLFGTILPRYANRETHHHLPYRQDKENVGEQVFDMVTWFLLDGVPVTVNGSQSTIGKLIRSAWEHNPKNRYQSSVKRGQDAIEKFNLAFSGILPQLTQLVSELLEYFENHRTKVRFLWRSLSWNRDEKRIDGATLLPQVEFRDKDLGDHPHLILNEARLSAIAICLFLAGVLLSDTDTENPSHPRFLVLDDALIGLELQNRIPVLEILKSDRFRNYQKILMTHDRVWYDLSRGHLPESSGWIHRELVANEAHGRLVPRIKPGLSDLEIARNHLANGDLRAAAVYARAALETRIRNVCEKKGIDVKFRKDPNEISLDKLWQGILARQTQRGQYRANGHPNSPDFIPQSLIVEVDAMRSNVLNALSHASAPGLNATDVETAISTVKKVQNHSFPDA